MEKARGLIAALSLLALIACSSGAVHTATFATLDEAHASGAFDKGWMPAELPQAAYELRAAYALDGPGRWGLFNFDPGDADRLRAILQPEEVPLAGTVMDVPGRIEWWPVILRGRLDAERIQTTGLRAYHSRDASLVFAVNWSQGRAYYWSIR